jgi:hypothetical protein
MEALRSTLPLVEVITTYLSAVLTEIWVGPGVGSNGKLTVSLSMGVGI